MASVHCSYRAALPAPSSVSTAPKNPPHHSQASVVPPGNSTAQLKSKFQNKQKLASVTCESLWGLRKIQHACIWFLPPAHCNHTSQVHQQHTKVPTLFATSVHTEAKHKWTKQNKTMYVCMYVCMQACLPYKSVKLLTYPCTTGTLPFICSKLGKSRANVFNWVSSFLTSFPRCQQVHTM